MTTSEHQRFPFENAHPDCVSTTVCALKVPPNNKNTNRKHKTFALIVCLWFSLVLVWVSPPYSTFRPLERSQFLYPNRDVGRQGNRFGYWSPQMKTKLVVVYPLLL